MPIFTSGPLHKKQVLLFSRPKTPVPGDVDLLLKNSDIEELCTEFPSTVVLLDHLAFCKPPANDEESKAFSWLLELSRFPQPYRPLTHSSPIVEPFPYEDLSHSLSQVVSTFGANRVIWGTDYPYVVPECGYEGAKEASSLIANQVPSSASELDWIMGRTVMELFLGKWHG